MPTISCPSCGATDDLSGADLEDGKLIRCGRCDHTWQRDLTARCGLCGSTDLEEVATATLEEAGRGEQRTPSGIRTTHRCYGCGARDATSSNPVPAPADWRRRGSPVRPVVTDAAAADRPDREERLRSAFGTFEVGATVGDGWHLDALLARTSTGTLWRATGTAGEVVFKLVRGADVQQQADAHADAARAVAVVRHPHLLAVRGVLRRGNDALIAIEPIEAQPLVRPVGGDVMGRVAPAVSGALAALHDHGLVHLDIRPDKLLIDEAGRARLVDLGSGRVRAREAGTGPGARIAWRAPEQVVGSKHTPAADVYSLALSLWHLAGGRLDDLGSTVSEQVAARVAADLPVLDDDAVGVPTAVCQLLAAATRRRPEQRPESAELAAGLAAALDG